MRQSLLVATLALAVVLVATPAATACHYSWPVKWSPGVVVTPDGPVPVRVEFADCEGPGRVRLSDLVTGEPIESFGVTVEVDDPFGGSCAIGPCGLGSPATRFRLHNEALGVDLRGTVQNGVHYAVAWQVVGTVHGLPAAWAAAAHSP